MPQAPCEKNPPDDRGFPSKPAKSGKPRARRSRMRPESRASGCPPALLGGRPLFNHPRRPPSRMGALCPSRPRRPLESRAAHTPLEPRASPVPHSRRPRQPQAANARQNRSFAKRAPPRRRPAPAIAASRTNARAGRARVRRKDGRQGRPPASETSPRSGSAPCDRLPRRPRTPPRQPRAASRRRTHGVRPRARRRRAPPR